MKVPRTADGLFIATVDISFKGASKRFTALVDTGSNICACSYKVITAFRARPTSFKGITAPTGGVVHTVGYSLGVGFDGKSEMVHVYRVQLHKMDSIDLILGLSVLNRCTLTMNGNEMEVSWN